MIKKRVARQRSVQSPSAYSILYRCSIDSRTVNVEASITNASASVFIGRNGNCNAEYCGHEQRVGSQDEAPYTQQSQILRSPECLRNIPMYQINGIVREVLRDHSSNLTCLRSSGTPDGCDVKSLIPVWLFGGQKGQPEEAQISNVISTATFSGHKIYEGNRGPIYYGRSENDSITHPKSVIPKIGIREAK